MLRAAWKSLMGRKVRLLMSTFAIVLGVAFVVGTLIFSDTLNKSFVNIFNNSVGDVVVQPEGGAEDADDASSIASAPIRGRLVDRLADVQGAARADGQVATGGVFLIDKDNKVVGGQGPPTISVNDSDAPAAHGAEPFGILEGRAPQGGDEVAINRSSAEAAGYFLGERVRLVTAQKRAIITPRLVGLAGYPEGGSLNGATILVWDTPQAQELAFEGRNRFSQVWVTAESGVSQADLRDAVAAELPKGLEAVTGDKAAKDSASEVLEATSFITTFLLVFAGIALVVGCFLIVNTFSILVAQRSRELALLRALGASRRQVTRSVLVEAFVVGLVGSTVGIALGALLAVGIRSFFSRFGLDLSGQDFIYAPRTFLIGYAVGMVVTMAAAYFPARRSATIPPIAALRDDVALPASSIRWRFLAGVLMVIAGGALGYAGLELDVPEPTYWVGAGVLAALLGVAVASPVISKPFLMLASGFYTAVMGTVGRLAGQNSLRNPRRTAATASALMIGLALVTTMSIAGASANASVEKSIRESFIADLVVGSPVRQDFSPAIARKAERIQGVDSVTRVRSDRTRVMKDGKPTDDRTRLTGVDQQNLADVLQLHMVSGSIEDLDGRSILVPLDDSTEKGWKVGDTVSLRTPKGVRDLKVVGVYRDDNPVIWSPVTTLRGYNAMGFPRKDSSLYVDIAPDADAYGIQQQLTDQLKKLPTVTVRNQQEFIDEARAQVDQFVYVIYALLGLALVIAVLGVVNTLGLSVIERTREIGLLRAVGLSRPQLRRMVGLESVVIAVLGALLGVGMGIVFGMALTRSLVDEGLTETAIPYPTLGGYILAAAVIGVVAAVFPARRAAKLDVLRAIATE